MATSTLGSGTLVLAGTTSGTTTVTATAVAGTTTLTLPAATDTLVGKATTDTLTNKTLTGAVMNGTLGATTPSTVAATTLTTSSTVTHNGGTANGVPYLNGSKVLTTGSALTFDGTVLTLGTSSAFPLTDSKLSIGNDANSALRLGISNQNAGASSLVGIDFQPAGGAWKIDVPADTSGFVPPMYFKAGASTNVTFAYNGAVGIGYTNTSSIGANGLAVLGNVGIGTSSPAYNLEVSKSQDALTNIAVTNASAGTAAQTRLRLNNGGSNFGTITHTGASFTTSGVFRADGTYVFGNGTGGLTLTTGAAQPIYFAINNSEVARFDTSGNLLVGTASGLGSSGKVQSLQTAQSVAGLSVDATNASFDYKVVYLNTTIAASSAFDFIQCTTGGYGTVQFRVRGDGVIFAQNTTVQSISDARVKENVRDAGEGLQTVLGLRPVRFDFKEGFGNNRKNQLGFIAQEVEAVFSDAVDVAGELDENGDPYKSVGPSAMIPLLVAAIKEQQALITQLTARIVALESA